MLVVLAVTAAPAAAAFPGTPGRIVFSSGGDLHTALPGSPAVQDLTTTPGVEEAQAAWSPDGSRVAFRVGTAGTSDVLQIAVMNADGGGRTIVTSGDHHSTQPTWSPDGRQIVFRRSVPGVNLSGDVWIMGADGSAPRPLLTLPGDERYPSLSPDGGKLAFTTHASAGDDVEIAVAGSDGSGPTAVTDNAVFDSAPSWSPDGRRIAFERGPAGDDPGNDVWSMAADGGDQRQLTTTAGLDEGPGWSPDGSRIVFTSTRAGTSDIWTMDASGGDQQPLTTLPGKEESPDWQALPVTPPTPAVPSSPVVPGTPSTLSAPKLSLRLTPGQSLRTLAAPRARRLAHDARGRARPTPGCCSRSNVAPAHDRPHDPAPARGHDHEAHDQALLAHTAPPRRRQARRADPQGHGDRPGPQADSAAQPGTHAHGRQAARVTRRAPSGTVARRCPRSLTCTAAASRIPTASGSSGRRPSTGRGHRHGHSTTTPRRSTAGSPTGS